VRSRIHVYDLRTSENIQIIHGSNHWNLYLPFLCDSYNCLCQRRYFKKGKWARYQIICSLYNEVKH
jgi:hypothetical protein